MIRMLIVGYVFAIRSERRICAEVRVNLAYRWFCKLGIEDKIPDHSVFCRARHERFRESDALRRVFDDGFEIISVFSCLHGQNEGSSNVEKQMNPIGGMHQIFFRGAAHSTQCIARQTARQTARCFVLADPHTPLCSSASFNSSRYAGTMLRRPRRSIREAVLAHSQGDDQTLLRPVECDGAAELCGHSSMHQLAPEAFGHRGSH